jgi:hypothetical protein
VLADQLQQRFPSAAAPRLPAAPRAALLLRRHLFAGLRRFVGVNRREFTIDVLEFVFQRLLLAKTASRS